MKTKQNQHIINNAV